MTVLNIRNFLRPAISTKVLNSFPQENAEMSSKFRVVSACFSWSPLDLNHQYYRLP